MNQFTILNKKLQEQVAKMTADSNLFVVDLDKDELWKKYLENFPEGTNPIMRKRTEHNCSACRHFIKSFGNVVSIKNTVVTSIWDFDIPNSKYEPSIKAMSRYVKSLPISDVFITNDLHFGVKKNFEKVLDDIITWEHFYVELSDRFKNISRMTVNEYKSKLHGSRNVFKRSLDEISQDAVISVLELISEKSLYKGDEWKSVLETFHRHQKAYESLSSDKKDLYVWEQSLIAGPVIGKIRNHSIGVLLIDITNGIDIEEAIRKYEAIVAPTNYKRPKAIFTAKMLKDAEKIVTELGYMDSLRRRHATIDDITINNILFADRNVTICGQEGSIFDQMSKQVITNPKKFDRIEEISIYDFVSDVLPNIQNIEVLLENRHASNMVSLIAPQNIDAPSMFKWSNPFSWAYAGNITDCDMKQRVKSLGGDVSGVLRFSIQWNTKHDNENDFDAHCIEPNRNEIYFRNKGIRHSSSGMLDVDIVGPSSQTKDGIAIENITWSDLSQMPEGKYQFFVNNFNHRGGRSGFIAEIEFNGQIHSFAYNKELKQSENVQVADVIYSRKNGFSIVEKIPFSMSSRKIWNLTTNEFYSVSIIMMSPNFWDNQDGIGNKHFFFMLKDCINEEMPNGFFNEYLKNELIVHKRVFEALGSKMRVESSDNQLSGIGFSSTQRNYVVVKVTGHIDRMLKVTF